LKISVTTPDSRTDSMRGRKGGVIGNTVIFVSAACAVGVLFVFILKNFFTQDIASSVTEDTLFEEVDPVLTEQEMLKIKEEEARLEAEREAERQRVILEQQEKAKELRLKKRLQAAQDAILAKEWKTAEVNVGLLLDDAYSLDEVAKLNEKKVQSLLESAQALDKGQYSPEALELLEQALLIYPGHGPSEALRKKFMAYPYELRVPEDAETIMEAVKLLRSGDTVLLNEGVYKLPVLINKAVKIKGKGEMFTFIESDTREHSAFTLAGDDGAYLISDLTVQGVNYEDDAVTRFPLIVTHSDLMLRNVTVKNGSGHGVAVLSGRLNMVNCRSTGNAWDGVSVVGKGSYAEITDCEMSDNFEHGVDFWNGASGKLTKVTANRNTGSGVVIMGKAGKVDLEQIRTQDNSQCGVVISSQAESKLDRVFSSGNVLSGVVIQGQATKVVFGITVANNNGEAGFIIDPASTVENFISTTSEGNSAGNLIKKALVVPELPAPPKVIPVEDDKVEKKGDDSR